MTEQTAAESESKHKGITETNVTQQRAQQNMS